MKKTAFFCLPSLHFLDMYQVCFYFLHMFLAYEQPVTFFGAVDSALRPIYVWRAELLAVWRWKGSYLVLLFVFRWQQKLASVGFMLNLEWLIPLCFANLCFDLVMNEKLHEFPFHFFKLDCQHHYTDPAIRSITPADKYYNWLVIWSLDIAGGRSIWIWCSNHFAALYFQTGIAKSYYRPTGLLFLHYVPE